MTNIVIYCSIKTAWKYEFLYNFYYIDVQLANSYAVISCLRLYNYANIGMWVYSSHVTRFVTKHTIMRLEM